MAKIRRQDLPRALYAHLLDRVQQRNISAQQLLAFVVVDGHSAGSFPRQVV